MAQLIPQATNRKPKFLTDAVSSNMAANVAHAPAPSVKGIVLSSTPPDTVVTNADETTNVVTGTTRKGCKTVVIGAVAILDPTVFSF